MTVITRQQQRLEGLLQQHASPVPMPHRHRPWLLVGAGVVIRLLLGAGHRWLISPINPAPQAEACRQLHFRLAQLDPAALDAVLPPGLARRWAPGGDLHHHLGPQRSQPAAAAAPPAEPSSC